MYIFAVDQFGSTIGHAIKLPLLLKHSSFSYSINKKHNTSPEQIWSCTWMRYECTFMYMNEVLYTVIVISYIWSPPGFSNTQQLDCACHPVIYGRQNVLKGTNFSLGKSDIGKERSKVRQELPSSHIPGRDQSSNTTNFPQSFSKY